MSTGSFEANLGANPTQQIVDLLKSFDREPCSEILRPEVETIDPVLAAHFMDTVLIGQPEHRLLCRVLTLEKFQMLQQAGGFGFGVEDAKHILWSSLMPTHFTVSADFYPSKDGSDEMYEEVGKIRITRVTTNTVLPVNVESEFTYDILMAEGGTYLLHTPRPYAENRTTLNELGNAQMDEEARRLHDEVRFGDIEAFANDEPLPSERLRDFFARMSEITSRNSTQHDLLAGDQGANAPIIYDILDQRTQNIGVVSDEEAAALLNLLRQATI